MSHHHELEWREHCANPASASWTRASTCTRTARRLDLCPWLALCVALVGAVILILGV